jgi:CheY-like chemotaxis protein
VNNGQEALDRVDGRSDYDAILMDLQMPVLDGFEATRRLLERGCRIPIIALTAHAMKDELEKVRQRGFADCLTKPINRPLLIETLVKVIRSELLTS